MTLPCGCKIDTIEDTFVMEPCSPDCEYYLYAMAEIRRQAKPVRAIVDPEMTAEELARYGLGDDRG